MGTGNGDERLRGPEGGGDKDVFILHAEDQADATFVRSYLVPELGLSSDRVLLSSALPPGMTVVQALEQGVVTSRVTVAVVSPAFLHESWSIFGETLAGYHAIYGGLLVPLLLSDCALPLRLEFRVRLDCRESGRRAAEIARLRSLLDLAAPPEREIPCPYPGMRPYTAENAALFCGRTRDIDRLVSLIAGGLRELYVIGPSGSGKSSLLRSGVVPRLERAVDPVVREPFVVQLLRPGSAPGQRLAATVGSLGSYTARTLIVIDQLEEVFTLTDRAGRREFFAGLDKLRAIPAIHLAFALRADFQGALMQSELWPHVLRSHRHELEPLRGDALCEAISVPAQRVGVDLEPTLLERLVGDAANEPGALPLIQEALVHLWGKRERNLLTAAQYARAGDGVTSGLAVALSNRADASFAALDDIGQAIARRVFLRLVSFGEGRADTRRQQPLSALRDGLDPERFIATLHHLTECRLLTADGDETSGNVVVDLAHEALIAAWPRLQEWIRMHRKTEQQRRYLEVDAAQWAQRAREGRNEVGLLDDGQLIELDGWFTADLQRDIGVGQQVEAFVAASRAAAAARFSERAARAAADAARAAKIAEQEARDIAAAVRRRRWLRWTTVALVALTTAAAALSIFRMTAVVLISESAATGDTARVAAGTGRDPVQLSSPSPKMLAASDPEPTRGPAKGSGSAWQPRQHRKVAQSPAQPPLGGATPAHLSIAKPASQTADISTTLPDTTSAVESEPHSDTSTPAHGSAADPTEAEAAPNHCSEATFTAIYDAPEPAPGAVRAALRQLRACRDSGAITNGEFDRYQSALITRL